MSAPFLDSRLLGTKSAKVLQYSISPPATHTIDHMLNPEYWKHVAGMFKPGTIIDVYSQDGSVDATLRVVDCNKVMAKVRIMRLGYVRHMPTIVEDDNDESSKEAELDIQVSWGGPKHLWRIVHGKAIIDKGYKTEELAEKARKRYLERVRTNYDEQVSKAEKEPETEAA
jgi:hypothetical protein